MRNIAAALLLLLSGVLQGQDLSYYLPDSVTYDPAIPKPKEVIFHEVGEWHVTHDRLVNYMKAIAAAAPERVKIETMGFTYEQRPQVLLIITSPKNHKNLQKIREQHLLLTDPSRSASVSIEQMPAVVWVGHSIHGNEPSGSNSALVSSYYLAAAQGKQIDDLLENVVILLDPSFNPDGMQRFSTWVNQHKSKTTVTDPSSREFNEVWPGGRFNHYWFDLNRDWLPAVHVESRNRLAKFHEWKPNILTDHHEMGSNSTFFFQPGVPSRVNPLTPEKNQELTNRIANFHANFLDRIGSFYYTKEGYDDFYYGKGSTYPDINGAVGILFEQASSRGHAQETTNGLLTFPFTIRNQFITTLSTLEAARSLRKDLLSFQRDFYRNIQQEAAAAPVKAYVFGDEKDPGKTQEFASLLRLHQIEVNKLANNITAGDMVFNKESSFIVPSSQPQHRLIKAIFEKTLAYKDSLFYDITSWTMPLAYGLPSAELTASSFNNGLIGSAFTPSARQGAVTAKTEYAYVMEWSDFKSPAALYQMQDKGVITRVATNTFSMNISGQPKKFSPGSIMIPVRLQSLESNKLFDILKKVAADNSVTIYGLSTGVSTSGSDLGSSRFANIIKPTIATIVGPGVTATDAGELWHLLDQRFHMPLTHLDIASANRADLSRYNVIILVAGNYSQLDAARLKSWIQAGGTLILMEEAIQWGAQSGLSSVTFKKIRSSIDTTALLKYDVKDQIEGAQAMRGAIFRAEADLSHPLTYGYSQPYVNLFKSNKVYMEKTRNPFNTPLYYRDKPLLSGWVSQQNLDAVKNSAAVVVNGFGSGKVISIAENPNFRAFWLGGSKLMMNAIFFGKIIDTNFSGTD